MPQAASETNAHLINHAYRTARPDRAPGEEAAKTTGKQAKPESDIVDDGEPGNGAVTDTGTAEPTGTKTAAAVAPTPTAAAHSENPTHAADAAEGRTPPAATLQAAAGKPADAQGEGEEKKAAAGELPPQSNAEDAPRRSRQKPALREHVDLPAQSHRNAPPDNAAMPSLNNALAAAKATADSTQPLASAGSLPQRLPAQSPTATNAISR